MFRYPAFESNRHHVHKAGVALDLPFDLGGHASGVLVRADRCTTHEFSRCVWFVAARSELREDLKLKAPGDWFRSVLLVNADTQLPRVEESLVVCDGDVELVIGLNRTVVVANGRIWSKKWGGSRDSYLAATGDIVLPETQEVGTNVYHAGGTVRLSGKAVRSDQVREGRTSLPFGIRFLDPAEFGLTLAGDKGGVRVSAVAADSPFARHGVEAGDLIAAIDDVKGPSIPAFRRQLRRGVLAESVVLTIRRADRALTRIVFLDGVPEPAVPMPRAAKPARPAP
jgi:hypothetical protein